ncbi:hypothetical protein D3C85_1227310 [compost metagenome]
MQEICTRSQEAQQVTRFVPTPEPDQQGEDAHRKQAAAGQVGKLRLEETAYCEAPEQVLARADPHGRQRGANLAHHIDTDDDVARRVPERDPQGVVVAVPHRPAARLPELLAVCIHGETSHGLPARRIEVEGLTGRGRGTGRRKRQFHPDCLDVA